MSLTLNSYPPEMAWAIVQAKNQTFAVPTQDLREMVLMPEVAEVNRTTGKEVITGKGMESNEDFTKYEIKQVTGQFQLKGDGS